MLPVRLNAFLIPPAALLLLLSCLPARAQHLINGTVKDDTTAAPLWRVTIRNTVSGGLAFTDEQGAFSIDCRPGDTITLSMVGYITQRIAVHADLFALGTLQCRLRKAVVVLSQQLVRGRNYLADSLRLREEYGSIFNYRTPAFPIFSWKSPDSAEAKLRDPFRVLRAQMNVNQLSQALSRRKKARNKKFRGRLLELEAGRFVEHYYDTALVAGITGLHDDSLQQFVTQYRPAAGFLQSCSQYDLMLFIKNSYALYRDSLKRRDNEEQR